MKTKEERKREIDNEREMKPITRHTWKHFWNF